MRSLGPAVQGLVAAEDVSGLARLAGYRKRFGSWKASGREDGSTSRVPAVQGLGELGSRHPDGVRALLTTMATADADQDVRAAAVSGLGVLGSRVRRRAGGEVNDPGPVAGVGEALVRALDDPGERVRAAAVEALGATSAVPSSEAWARLLPRLEDPSPLVRLAAGRVLGDRPESRTDEGLAALAGVGTAEAVVALGGARAHRGPVRGAGEDSGARIDAEVLRPAALRAPETYFAAIDLLAGLEGARGARSALVEARGDRRCAPLGPVLARRLEDRSDRALRQLVDALARTGATEAGPALMGLLGDRSVDHGVRCQALWGLESLGADLPVSLLDGMQNLAASYVEQHLAEREDAVPALIELATRPTAEPGARQAALGLLATKSDDRIVEPLLDLALDERESAQLRVRAIETLGGRTDDRVVALEPILVADTTPAEPALGTAPAADKGHEAALNDPWAESPQYLIRWRPRSDAGLGVAAGLALAPFVDDGTSGRVRLGVLLAQRRADAIREWVEEEPAPGSADDRTDARDFLLRRLDWLDVEQGMDVALAMQKSGFAPAGELVRSLRALAQQMTRMADVEAEEVFMGDQTIQKRTVTVSRDETRARGREYLRRLGEDV